MRIFSLACFAALVFYGCISTDTKSGNPNEKVFTDIHYQWSGGVFQSEVRFYVQDSSESRPYFLQTPVYVEGMKMDKQFAGEKGVFYKLKSKSPKLDEAHFKYTDLNGEEVEIKVPIGEANWTLPLREFTKKDLLDLPLEGNQSLALIDQQQRLFNIVAGTDLLALDRLKLGEVRIICVHKEKGQAQIKGKHWLRYETRAVSPMEMAVLK